MVQIDNVSLSKVTGNGRGTTENVKSTTKLISMPGMRSEEMNLLSLFAHIGLMDIHVLRCYKRISFRERVCECGRSGEGTACVQEKIDRGL